MLSDLAALTPPTVVCVAFLIGLGLFLRRQLGPKRESADDEYPDDISGDSGIPHGEGSESTASPDRGDG
ncbi:MAG TPA: hypothetical protein VMV92_02610 [Streptosporangiaceae bacterium]|nr:hypothetical protein [Streptosporangiaceae bacterium]